MLLCFFKNRFRGNFARSSRLRASREMVLRVFFILSCHTETFATVSRLTRDQQLLAKCCLAKIGFFKFQTEDTATDSRLYRDLELLAKSLCFSGPFRGCLATVSLLPNPRKTRVFSFYMTDVTVFSKYQTSLAQPFSNSLNPKSLFHSFPFNPSTFSAFSSSRYVS